MYVLYGLAYMCVDTCVLVDTYACTIDMIANGICMHAFIHGCLLGCNHFLQYFYICAFMHDPLCTHTYLCIHAIASQT